MHGEDELGFELEAGAFSVVFEWMSLFHAFCL